MLEMAWTEALTIAAVLLLSAWLAGRAPLPARIVLWTSVFLVSAAMFLPSSTLYSIFGKDRVGAIARGTAHLPWDLSTIAHFGAFLLMAVVLWWFRPEWRGWRVVGVLVALAIGGELMQGLGVDRSPRLLDVAVNLMGVGAGLVLGLLGTRLRHAAAPPRGPDSEGMDP